MRKLLTSFFACLMLLASANSFACSGPILFGNSGATLPNTFTVAANSTLLINNNITLSEATIMLMDNAKIEIAPGVTFTLINSGVHACSQNSDLWDKIEVPSGATFIANGTRIHDSKHGVYSVGGGDFQITNSYLSNNLTHLTVLNFQGNHPGSITGTLLRNDVIPNTLSLTSADYEASILIENVGHVKIGDNNSTQNLISEGKYGIYSSHSSVTIENNKFNYFNDLGDKAIYNNTGQDIIVDNNIIDNSNVAIEQYQLEDSEVLNNKIGSVIRGAYLTDCQTSIVRYNTIKGATYAGIEVRNMEDNYPIGIEFNNVIDTEYGIVAQTIPATVPTLPDIKISANNIEGVRIGIYGYYLKTLHNINENIIKYQQTGNNPTEQGVGIYLNKSWYTTIQDNHITDGGASSPTSPSTNGIGILNAQSAHTTVVDNKVIGASKGIAYTNNFSDVNLECNTLQECYDGFYFDGNASNSSNPFEVIGDDIIGVSSGNKWQGAVNFDIDNSSTITLEWWYNDGNIEETPNPISLGVNLNPTSNNATCWPAPARLAQEVSELRMYPNPCADEITIEISEENSSIQLFNLMGQLVLEQKLSNAENKIDVSSLAPGIYQSKISSASEVLKTEKIIISR